MYRTIVIHVYDRRGRALPSVALPKLHVFILASCSRRLVRPAPLGHFAGAYGDEGGEFAGPGAAAVPAEGELAGDFGGEVTEEVRHGDEAAADDAGGNLGDSIVGIAWSAYEIQKTRERQAHVHNATGNR